MTYFYSAFHRTLDMVEHAVLMICSYMPNTVTDKCVDFVQEYGDEIIDLIVKAEMNPEMVCSALTLCTGSEQRSTWGKYWSEFEAYDISSRHA